ncbi:MAG: bacteriocin-protection protein [Flavobacterium sp.]|nr:MAG: bacteriocin-protection protein [Flavobacterium sp.]
MTLEPKFFTAVEFRKWLEKNHKTENEILIGFHKVGTKKQTMTWSESVDQALCFGWIDGVRKGIDSDSYTIRFTPRKSKSIWSKVNIAKVAELTANGMMTPAGIAAFNRRNEAKSGIYIFENAAVELPDDFVIKFKENPGAWEFFNRQPPSYRKTMKGWVMQAKQEKTRLSRLEKLIGHSSDEKRII